MQHLHAEPLGQGFKPHPLHILPFAPFEQHGDGLEEVVVLDEIRGPNQQLPEPLVFWQLREVRGRFAPPQAFQLADGIVLQPGELAGHLDREGHAVEGSDAGGEHLTAGSALTRDGQIAGGLDFHQGGFAGGGLFGLMEFIQVQLRLRFHFSVLGLVCSGA